jgi:MarR family transcriptional repressor of emrRAB
MYYFNMNKKALSDKGLSRSETVSMAERAHQRIAGAGLGDIHLNILIRQSYLLTVEHLNRILLPFGLSHVGYFAMMMLSATPNNLANPSDLCGLTGETRANMTRICDELVAKGWLHRVASTEDRRRVDLSLTDAGVELLHEVVPVLRGRVKTILSDFDETEKAMLERLLTKLNNAIEAKA